MPPHRLRTVTWKRTGIRFDCRGAEYHLKPLPVSITACANVDAEWHARFSAVERQYVFRLLCRRSPVHDAGLVWQVNRFGPRRDAEGPIITEFA